MKAIRPGNFRARSVSSGITLIELTVVILVMLSLISVLMIGASAWKSGADRASCILNISHTQKAGRSLQNISATPAGDPFDSSMIIGQDNFVNVMPVCKGDGTYTFVDAFPEPGTLFMACSVTSHVPAAHSDW